jgi:anti-anti-sigma factor
MLSSRHGRLALVDVGAIFASPVHCHQLVDTATSEGIEILLLDLHSYPLIDSMQIGLLFGLARHCSQAGRQLAVCGAQPTVQQSLRWVNAQRVMAIHADRASAFQAAGIA